MLVFVLVFITLCLDEEEREIVAFLLWSFERLVTVNVFVSLSLSHWYPGSGVIVDCIDS